MGDMIILIIIGSICIVSIIGGLIAISQDDSDKSYYIELGRRYHEDIYNGVPYEESIANKINELKEKK